MYCSKSLRFTDAKTMCFDLNEGVQEDFRPNPTNSDAK